MKTKLCRRCGLSKPLSEFSRHKRDGYKSRCKACDARDFQEVEKERRRLRRARPQKRTESLCGTGLKRCPKCGEEKPFSAFAKATRRKDGLQANCKECCSDYSRSHPDKGAARQRKFRIERPEKARAISRRYRDNHPEREAERIRKFRQQNPEVGRTNCRNRHARKKRAGGVHTALDIAFLMQVQGGKCAHSWCRKSLNSRRHVDHRMPLARGGLNDRTNLQLLCPTCNQRKHAKDPIVFAQENGMLL